MRQDGRKDRTLRTFHTRVLQATDEIEEEERERERGERERERGS